VIPEIVRKYEDAVAERDRLIALLTTLVTITKERKIVIDMEDIERAYDAGESITIWAPEDVADKRVVILKATNISKEDMKKRVLSSSFKSNQGALFNPAHPEQPD